MARSRNRRSEFEAERVTSVNPSRELNRLLRPVEPYPVIRSNVSLGPNLWSEVEDLRRFDFNPPAARARRMDGAPAQIVHAPPIASAVREGGAAAPAARYGAPPRFRFADPSSVMVCVRRKMRREVLFAEKRTRAGSGAKRRRKAYTDVSC